MITIAIIDIKNQKQLDVKSKLNKKRAKQFCLKKISTNKTEDKAQL